MAGDSLPEMSFSDHSEPHSQRRPQGWHRPEVAYCFRGTSNTLSTGTSRLEPGDFLMFEAHLPHIWRNSTVREAEFLLVLQTPGESDEPVNRHFSNYPSLAYIG
jgi:quercetin dioxygenase-like cupin family protein